MRWDKGLTEEEARQRLPIYGRNEVSVSGGVVGWRILISQLQSPLVYVLLAAGTISLFLKHAIDAVVILATVIINTAFGFLQEYRAERSIEALTKLLTVRARVKRGDGWIQVDASQLVPGDIVKLTIGWKVPADGLLITQEDMYLGEAVLTGESMPIEKKTWMATDKFVIDSGEFDKIGDEHKGFMGTVVEKGVGEMLVVRTGVRTRIGLIAKVVKEKGSEKTPLQKRLDRMTVNLTLVVSAMAVAVFVYGWLTGGSKQQFLTTAVALAVAAIPEGLMVGLTVILTVGMRRILKRKAIVRGLLAAETLGSVSTICLDKTGTITEGKMEVVGVVSSLSGGVEEQIMDEAKHEHDTMKLFIEGAFLCNDQRDPLEISMRDWAVLRLEKKLGVLVSKQLERKSELPFDHETKYIAVRCRLEAGRMVDFVSGAPEVVLQRSEFRNQESGVRIQDSEIKERWKKQFGEVGARGYRMVALAMKEVASTTTAINREDIQGLRWLGLVVFSDPVREGVSESLFSARAAGIEVKMVTGDYKETAWVAARQVGLVQTREVDENLVMTGEEFEKLSTSDRDKKIKRCLVFVRTKPEQKLIIVEVLQKMGETVAMMGDGVNDVPALKRADIGIVVDNASDLAREVSDLILLDNNFQTILAAVEEGRAIFDNLRKVVLYLLSDAFAAVVVVVVAMYLGWPLPLLAAQILWINLISDGFPYMALTVEPKEKDLLRHKPITKEAPIMDRKRLILVGVISVTTGLLTLVVFAYNYFVLERSLEMARTLAFAMQGISSLGYVFSSRSLTRPIWLDDLWSNPLLNLGVLGGVLLQLAAVYWRPLQMVFGTVWLSVTDWGVILCLGLVLIGVIEIVKYLLFDGK